MQKKPFRFYYSIYERNPRRVPLGNTSCLIGKTTPKDSKKLRNGKHKGSSSKSSKSSSKSSSSGKHISSGKKLNVKLKDAKNTIDSVATTSGCADTPLSDNSSANGKTEISGKSHSKHHKKHKKHKSKRSKHKDKKSKSKTRNHQSSTKDNKRSSDSVHTDVKKQRVSDAPTDTSSTKFDLKEAKKDSFTGKSKDKKLTSPIHKSKKPAKHTKSHLYNATVVKSVKSLIVKNVECAASNHVDITTVKNMGIPEIKKEIMCNNSDVKLSYSTVVKKELNTELTGQKPTLPKNPALVSKSRVSSDVKATIPSTKVKTHAANTKIAATSKPVKSGCDTSIRNAKVTSSVPIKKSNLLPMKQSPSATRTASTTASHSKGTSNSNNPAVFSASTLKVNTSAASTVVTNDNSKIETCLKSNEPTVPCVEKKESPVTNVVEEKNIAKSPPANVSQPVELSTPKKSPNVISGLFGGSMFKNRKSPGGLKNIDNLATKLMDNKVKSIAQQKGDIKVSSQSAAISADNQPLISAGLLTKVSNATTSVSSTPQKSADNTALCRNIEPILETIQGQNVLQLSKAEDVKLSDNNSNSGKVKSTDVVANGNNTADMLSINVNGKSPISGSSTCSGSSPGSSTEISPHSSRHKKSGKHKHKSKDKHRRHSRTSSGEYTGERVRHHSKSKKREKEQRDREDETDGPSPSKSPKHEDTSNDETNGVDKSGKKYCIANDPTMENSKRLITKIKLKSLDRPSPPKHPPPSKHRIFSTKSKSCPAQAPIRPLSITLSLGGTATTVIKTGPMPIKSAPLEDTSKPVFKFMPLEKTDNISDDTTVTGKTIPISATDCEPEHKTRTMSLPAISHSEMLHTTINSSVSDNVNSIMDPVVVLSAPVIAKDKTMGKVTDSESTVTSNTVTTTDTCASDTKMVEQKVQSCEINDTRVTIRTVNPGTSNMLLTGGSNLHNKTQTNDSPATSISEMNKKNRALGMKSKHTEGSTKPIYVPKTTKTTVSSNVITTSASRVISLTKTTVSSTTVSNGEATTTTSETTAPQLICYTAPGSIPVSGTQTLIIPTPGKIMNKTDVFSSLAKMQSLKVYTPSSPVKGITTKVPDRVVGTSAGVTPVNSRPMVSIPMSLAYTTTIGAAGSNVRPSKSPHICVQSMSHLHPLNNRGAVALQPRSKVSTAVMGSSAVSASSSTTTTITSANGHENSTTTVNCKSEISNGVAKFASAVTKVPAPAHTGSSPPPPLLHLTAADGVMVPPPAHTRVPPAGSSPPSSVSPDLPVDCSTSPLRNNETSNNNKLISTPHSGLDEQDTPLDLHRPKVLSVS